MSESYTQEPVKVLHLGRKPYQEVWDLQKELFRGNLVAKEQQRETRSYLILCEHPPVFTLGKNGKRENILVSDDELHADFFQINRGGDATFHGPGQLVVYPILDLEKLKIGLAEYICRLEETIIQSIVPYGLHGERIPGAAGIWLRKPHGVDEKIAAIGVKASRYITMHGTAININTDLSYFAKIVPCGLKDKGVTSLQKETGRQEDMEQFKQLFLQKFQESFAVLFV